MLLPRTIKGLSILTAVISALVILALGATVVFFSHEEIEAQIGQRIEVEMNGLTNYRRRHNNAQLAQFVQARDGLTTTVHGFLANGDGAGRTMFYAMWDPQGRQVAGAPMSTRPPLGWTEFLPIDRVDGTRGFARALSRRLPDGARLLVAGDREALNQSDDRISMVVLTGLGAILLVGATSTIAFGRLVHRRLATISGAAQSIIEGDYSRRVPLDESGSEFERIASILNVMFARIEASMQSLRQVSSDIAHDMRAPLGRIRRDMEALMLRSSDGASQASMGKMIAEMDALLDLFAGLLDVSEVQGFAVRRRFLALSLTDAISDVVEAYRPSFDQDGRKIEATLADVAIMGDGQLVRRLIANLLENILAHAGANANARITLSLEDGNARIAVADDGTGISPIDQERIFERLVRLEKTRSTAGHGLGLSMVRAIASAHFGTVEAIATEQGLTIILNLPSLNEGMSGLLSKQDPPA
ncbi:MAG: HAMP domain-containing sensor histidine kinase [Sphingobium sp.]|nr:HAMP domain-containing sensor histidine kinase [Sphingobium sp.]